MVGVEQNGVITWRKTNLGNDETFTVTYKVKVDEDINGKPVDNQAKVSTNYYKFETNKTHNPTPVMPKKPVVNSIDIHLRQVIATGYFLIQSRL